MKRIGKTLTFVVAVIVVFGAWRSAMAQAVRMPYRGLSTYVADSDSGRQCVTANRVLHVRNAKQLWVDDVSDPRIRGDVTLTVNVNFQLAPLPVFGYGPMWGTIRVENAGGSWEGSWVGKRTAQGHSFVQVALKGKGLYDGLHARADYVRTTPNPTAPFEVSGQILRTPAR